MTYGYSFGFGPYYIRLGAGPGSPCDWITEGEQQCGLLYGHDGDHTPHLIGGYLQLPILHPLDLLPIQTSDLFTLHRLRCPLCGTRVTEGIGCDGPTTTYHDSSWHAVTEAVWTFQPCGCEGRELLDVPQLHLPH